MSNPSHPTRTAGLIALGIVLCLAGCKPKPAGSSAAAPAKPVKPVVAVATNDASAQYVSVFEDLPAPKGRDPFFPDSRRREPAVPVHSAQAAHIQPQGELHLKGIVSSSSHRSAIINNSVLAEGEEDSVRVPDGALRVRCLQIGQDFAIVQVQGEAGPKRLALDEKHY